MTRMAAGQALDVQHQLLVQPRDRFWPDAVGYSQLSWHGVIGHRQVTDAYLAGPARHSGGRLVSFDKGLVALHADVVELIEGLWQRYHLAFGSFPPHARPLTICRTP